jgi:Domain of unknown function (DUF6487)
MAGFFVGGDEGMERSRSMAGKPECLVCKKEMEKGFLIDVAGGGVIALPRWCQGEPEKSFWLGEAKHSQLKEGVKVVAYRCPECEALRLYAPSEQ